MYNVDLLWTRAQAVTRVHYRARREEVSNRLADVLEYVQICFHEQKQVSAIIHGEAALYHFLSITNDSASNIT